MKVSILCRLQLLYAWLCILVLGVGCKIPQEADKPRLVVTCDTEEDDQNSLIRVLLHASDFRIEGLVYNASVHHWKGDGKGTKKLPSPGQVSRKGDGDTIPVESWRWPANDDFIHETVEAYGQVYDNLKVHYSDYPDPDYLMSRVKWGNVEFEGDISFDTPGSDLIKSLILDEVAGPLYLAAWGGASSIARALKSIEDTYSGTPEWDSLKVKITNKVVLCLSGDQDGTVANYITPNWPEIGRMQGGGSGFGLAYNSKGNAKPEQALYYSPEWILKNIESQGPLGERYRYWGDGKHWIEGDFFAYYGHSDLSAEELTKMGYVVWTPIHEKGSFLGEGDTHTVLNLFDNGLRAYEDQNYGGWGGRKRAIQAPVDRSDTAAMAAYRRQMAVTDYPDFLPAVMNAEAGRLAWSVTPEYKDANHEPVINGPLNITAKPGETVKIKTKVTDPDGNDVRITWHQFMVNNYEGSVAATNPNSAVTEVDIPEDIQPGQTIHMVLEALDNGVIPLTRYHRVIINIV